MPDLRNAPLSGIVRDSQIFDEELICQEPRVLLPLILTAQAGSSGRHLGAGTRARTVDLLGLAVGSAKC